MNIRIICIRTFKLGRLIARTLVVGLFEWLEFNNGSQVIGLRAVGAEGTTGGAGGWRLEMCVTCSPDV
jgi:hypothetical protein